MRCLILAIVFCCGSATLSAQPKAPIEKSKLLGVWELKGDITTRTIEFTKDGGFLTAIMGKAIDLSGVGVYSWSGDQLDVTLEIGGQKKSDRLTVEKLTDDVIVVVNGKGERSEFRRVK